VPYAYGALYNHPVEGFLLDTLGTGLAYLAAGMTVRQSMWFFTGSTIKTVDDHCGYRLPWDPLQRLFPNNAEYHDIHHQSWGIKTNFSQPFFTFWDKYLGTMWVGDVSARYEKARHAAQAKLEQENDNAAVAKPATAAATPRAARKKASSISQSPSGNLKGLSSKVNESLNGRGGNIYCADSSL
jgi:sphinganine C4-monooxygenase